MAKGGENAARHHKTSAPNDPILVEHVEHFQSTKPILVVASIADNPTAPRNPQISSNFHSLIIGDIPSPIITPRPDSCPLFPGSCDPIAVIADDRPAPYRSKENLDCNEDDVSRFLVARLPIWWSIGFPTPTKPDSNS